MRVRVCVRVYVYAKMYLHVAVAQVQGTTPPMLCFDQLSVCVFVIRVRVCVCVS